MRIQRLLFPLLFLVSFQLDAQQFNDYDLYMSEGLVLRKSGKLIQAILSFEAANDQPNLTAAQRDSCRREISRTTQEAELLERNRIRTTRKNEQLAETNLELTKQIRELLVGIDSVLEAKDSLQATVNIQRELTKQAQRTSEARLLFQEADRSRRTGRYAEAITASLMGMESANQFDTIGGLRAFYASIRDSLTQRIDFERGAITEIRALPNRPEVLVKTGSEWGIYQIGDTSLTILAGQPHLLDVKTNGVSVWLVTCNNRFQEARIWQWNGQLKEQTKITALSEDQPLMQFAPDCKTVATIVGSFSQRVIIWNATNGVKEKELTIPARIRKRIYEFIYLGPNQILIRSAGNHAAIWDGSEWRQLETSNAAYLHQLAYLDNSGESPESLASYATASALGTIQLFDASGSPLEQRTLGKSSMREIAYLPDTKQLVGRSLDPRLALWDMAKDDVVYLEHDDRLLGFRDLSDQGELLSWSSDGTLVRWAVGAVPDIRQRYRGHLHPIRSVQHQLRANGGSYLLSLDQSGRLLLWDEAGRQLLEWQNTGLPDSGFLLTENKVGLIVKISTDGQALEFMPNPGPYLQQMQQQKPDFYATWSPVLKKRYRLDYFGNEEEKY